MHHDLAKRAALALADAMDERKKLVGVRGRVQAGMDIYTDEAGKGNRAALSGVQSALVL